MLPHLLKMIQGNVPSDPSYHSLTQILFPCWNLYSPRCSAFLCHDVSTGTFLDSFGAPSSEGVNLCLICSGWALRQA